MQDHGEENIGCNIYPLFVLESIQHCIMTQTQQQSSILMSLLQGRSDPPCRRQVSLVPTPEDAVTSSSDSPRACCGTWWQPGEHLHYHMSSHHYRGFEQEDSGVTSSSSLNTLVRRRFTDEENVYVTNLPDSGPDEYTTFFKRQMGHLIADDCNISSSTDCY